VVCPDCQGNPGEAVEQVCPECKGQKAIRCAACGGTGVKSPPAMDEKEERKPEEVPTDK
jgi:RecJ-like exonuclease